MNINAINETIKTLAEMINNIASVALKLIIIGLIIVVEQWIEHV